MGAEQLFSFDELGVYADRVEWLRGLRIEISASDIRRRVAEGGSIRYLVPEPVERYIYARGLYRG